ncbi:hypothetical protein [Pseudomonas sp. PDM04]|uniref:hypothetical protein n=1 Tax=Pseudomonas sp. PDM04 TaxID=2769296 RepID=UPI00177E998F|nr:hypothetical protein [Pseudomonas sp. PDM04]MBD9442460.1 hypothetical protein [Pseudomonas sp. PDM04]
MIDSLENNFTDSTFNTAAQDAFFKSIEAELAAVSLPRRVKRSTAAMTDSAERKDPSPDTSIVGPSLVVFEQRLGAEDRQCALDSQAFAEAVVSRMPADSSQEKRYEKYNQCLAAAGWAMESFTRKQYDSQALTLTMNEALLQVLKTVISAGSGNILNLVASGFEQLKGDEKALTIVDSGSKNSQVVSFKAVPCIVAPGGGMAMVMGGLDVYSRNYRGNFLFFNFNTAGVHVFQAAGVRNFNRRAYERKRTEIEAYVDNFGQDLFKKLVG